MQWQNSAELLQDDQILALGSHPKIVAGDEMSHLDGRYMLHHTALQTLWNKVPQFKQSPFPL